jgi:SAM-dependent methyltransferase
VRGLRVLDAGCGPGENTAWLSNEGADVTAIDASATMVALAAGRAGPGVRIFVADLDEELPLPDGTFNIVLSSLTLHYLRSWEIVLREFRRVLEPGGRLVFSTHHPYLTVNSNADYHVIRLVEDVWTGFGDEPVSVRFYHRPLERIVNDLIAAGFSVTRIVEPQEVVSTAEGDPDLTARLRSQPYFLIFEAS